MSKPSGILTESLSGQGFFAQALGQAKEQQMGIESVKKYLIENGLHREIREFEGSTETVDLAAQALGVEPALIAKTLAFKVKLAFHPLEVRMTSTSMV